MTQIICNLSYRMYETHSLPAIYLHEKWQTHTNTHTQCAQWIDCGEENGTATSIAIRWFWLFIHQILFKFSLKSQFIAVWKLIWHFCVVFMSPLVVAHIENRIDCNVKHYITQLFLLAGIRSQHFVLLLRASFRLIWVFIESQAIKLFGTYNNSIGVFF